MFNHGENMFNTTSIQSIILKKEDALLFKNFAEWPMINLENLCSHAGYNACITYFDDVESVNKFIDGFSRFLILQQSSYSGNSFVLKIFCKEKKINRALLFFFA